MPNILLIEDDPNSQKLIFDYLSAYNCAVTVCEDGLSGLQAVKNGSFDAVILDLRLPGQNGFVVAQEIRKDPGSANVPIIVTSAFTDQANKMKAYQAGANFFLSKPIDLPELLMIINNSSSK